MAVGVACKPRKTRSKAEQGKWVATRLNKLIEYVEFLHEGCHVKME
jgi:hypothetical protein